MKAFEDTSIFDKEVEYLDFSGNYWKRIDDGYSYLFFKQSKNCFIKEGSVRKLSKKESIQSCHHRFMNIFYNDEEYDEECYLQYYNYEECYLQ